MKILRTKHKKIIFFTGGLLICAATALYASLILAPYNKSLSPTLSLPAAYDSALIALGPMTNQFHCLSANVTTTFAPEGEWYFTFYSTNKSLPPKFVVVEFNGKVIFDNGLR